MLNEGTAWYLKGLKNIMWRARFAKSTPFPNLIGYFGLRLQPHKTSKVVYNIVCGTKFHNLEN